ncbi:hypothetical protein EYZ11_011181 [Aspergillus tanneri]|uniref:Uncharacterized protein n=1 Tax=Aspergillus tanneri TaxID=1220188 RepID=A0A4S3J3F2_9EURO|nr:hypothetical protein EYZ11_011181 [Aspergillus tanneri]
MYPAWQGKYPPYQALLAAKVPNSGQKKLLFKQQPVKTRQLSKAEVDKLEKTRQVYHLLWSKAMFNI